MLMTEGNQRAGRTKADALGRGIRGWLKPQMLW